MFRVFEMFLNIAHKLSFKDALSLGNAQLLLRDLFHPFALLQTPIFWRAEVSLAKVGPRIRRLSYGKATGRSPSQKFPRGEKIQHLSESLIPSRGNWGTAPLELSIDPRLSLRVFVGHQRRLV